MVLIYYYGPEGMGEHLKRGKEYPSEDKSPKYGFIYGLEGQYRDSLSRELRGG